MSAPARIAAMIRQRNWTQAETATRMGISAAYLSDIVNKRRAITPRVALMFERVLGLDAAKLLYLQADAELRILREGG